MRPVLVYYALVFWICVVLQTTEFRQKAPVFTSSFKLPRWYFKRVLEYPHGVHAPFLAIVFEIAAAQPDVTDPIVLDSYYPDHETFPIIEGCLESAEGMLWIRVPLLERRNKVVHTTRCTPLPKQTLRMTYEGDNELLIEPLSIDCYLDRGDAVYCDKHQLTPTW